MVASACLDAILGHVVERDVEAGERAHVGDAGPHLAGADDPDSCEYRAACCPVPAGLLADL